MKLTIHLSLALGAMVTFAGAPYAQADVPIPPLPEFTKSDPDAYGTELALYQDSYDQGYVDEVLSGTMTLYDGDGDSVRRAFSRLLYERPGEGHKLITKFLSPAEIKGVAALTHENPGSSDDSWLYLPANKRVRRISGANNSASFQGTEFTYEDLGTLDPREYEWRFLEETTLEKDGESVPVFKLRARPTYDDTAYSHLIVYFHTTGWRRERTEFFDKSGKHLKTLEFGKWQHTHDRFWRPLAMDMSNHLTGKRTTLDVKAYLVDLKRYKSSKTGKARTNLTEDMFTTRALEG